MPSEGFAKVPSTVLAIGAIWAIGAYIAAPEIGHRLVTNGGEIQKCETSILSANARAQALAVSGVGPAPEAPARTQHNAGEQVFGALFRSYDGGDDFMRMYGDRLNNMVGSWTDLAYGQQMQEYEAAYNEWAARVGQAEERIRLDPAEASSVCECRAMAATNEGHSGLAWYVGTLSLVSGTPISDWQAAMRSPQVIAMCPARD